MNIALGAIVGLVVIATFVVVWRATRARRRDRTPESGGMQSALHAATATLPHLRARPALAVRLPTPCRTCGR